MIFSRLVYFSSVLMSFLIVGCQEGQAPQENKVNQISKTDQLNLESKNKLTKSDFNFKILPINIEANLLSPVLEDNSPQIQALNLYEKDENQFTLITPLFLPDDKMVGRLKEKTLFFTFDEKIENNNIQFIHFSVNVFSSLDQSVKYSSLPKTAFHDHENKRWYFSVVDLFKGVDFSSIVEDDWNEISLDIGILDQSNKQIKIYFQIKPNFSILEFSQIPIPRQNIKNFVENVSSGPWMIEEVEIKNSSEQPMRLWIRSGIPKENFVLNSVIATSNKDHLREYHFEYMDSVAKLNPFELKVDSISHNKPTQAFKFVPNQWETVVVEGNEIIRLKRYVIPDTSNSICTLPEYQSKSFKRKYTFILPSIITQAQLTGKWKHEYVASQINILAHQPPPINLSDDYLLISNLGLKYTQTKKINPDIPYFSLGKDPKINTKGQMIQQNLRTADPKVMQRYNCQGIFLDITPAHKK